MKLNTENFKSTTDLGNNANRNMKNEIELNDTMSYEDTIKAAFPKALIMRVDNFDDITYGWEICPKPGHLIVFRVMMDDEMKIIIEKFILNYSNRQVKVKEAKIFNGTIPPNEGYEPDHNFITKLLKSYLSIA